jgi:hypothetical protein
MSVGRMISGALLSRLEELSGLADLSDVGLELFKSPSILADENF